MRAFQHSIIYYEFVKAHNVHNEINFTFQIKNVKFIILFNIIFVFPNYIIDLFSQIVWFVKYCWQGKFEIVESTWLNHFKFTLY